MSPRPTFLSGNQAPLVEALHRSMTQSELFAVMVGGLASVAGPLWAGTP